MALLAEYDFNEGTGTTTVDLSGNGHSLTTSGSGWVSGGRETPYAGKADFSGIVGPNILQQSWTVMAWVKCTTFPGSYAAILSNNTDFYLELWHGSDGRLECFSGASGHPQTGDNAIALSTWTHIAVTRSADGTSLLFVNGNPIITGRGNAVNFGTGTWYIGGAAGNPSYVFDGAVDGFRTFDEALTANEVQAWMATPWGVTPPTLLASYAFNEASGATAIKDYSGNGITALASGASFTDGPLANTRAVTFTGSGQSVQIPRAGTEAASTGVTAMLWGKGPVSMDYLVKPRAHGGSTRMGIGPNWRVRWKDDLHYTDGGSGVNVNQWHHYCVIDADDQWAILIDGVYFDGNNRALNPATPGVWEDFPWIIGDTGGTIGLGVSQNGQCVADVRIFQGGMYSESQVQYYMNTPVAPQGRKFTLNGTKRALKLGSAEKYFGPV